MTLHSLKLKDFRQFQGIQKIAFPSRKEDTKANVTVIFGENGRGKTSIFRAIMFALFGDRKLLQDEDINEEELFLVNSGSLSLSDNKPLEAYVELSFSQRNTSYTIIRKIVGSYANSTRSEQPGEVVLYVTDKDGNTKTHRNIDEIRSIVNSILDRNISEYFLFDGEKIQRLTLASIEQKREIACGIRNLLNIDSLELSIKAITSLKKKLNTELVLKSTGEYSKVLKRLNELEDRKNVLEENIANFEKEYSVATVHKKRIDKELEKYSEINKLLEKRTELEQRIKELYSQRENISNEMRLRMGRTPFLFISDVINDVFSSIDNKKSKGEIPSEIRKDLIVKILAEKKCICGRDVLPGSPEFNNIIDWKNKTIDTELETSALSIWRHLSSVNSQGKELYDSITKLLKDFARCENEIENNRTITSEISKQIGSSDREDATELEKLRNNIEKKQIDIEANRKIHIQELNDIKQEIETTSARRKGLEQEEKLRSELSKRARITEDTLDALKDIHQKFTSEIREQIEKESNKYFNGLLDSESKKTLRGIIVGDDYSLQIIDKWNNTFLANISAGQRQIMSISFITALAKVASSGKILEMPLFMDTPFGRLSLSHRKNLVEKIPTYCSQWILLATDTEFRKEEALLLKQTGFWSKFYQLCGEGAGITKIVERNIEEAIAILMSNEVMNV